MKRSELADKHCSIARSSAQIVDMWTFVILRELFLGNSRFSGMEKQTGMSPRSLTLRLRKLEEEEVLTREGPKSKDYKLTTKGEALWPVLIMLKQWGDDWCGPCEEDGIPLKTMHKNTDHEMRASLVCAHCNEPVSTHSTHSTLSKAFQAERDIADSV